MSKPKPMPMALSSPRVLEDELGLDFPLPPRDPSWLNEPGEGTASRGQLQAWTRAFGETLAALRQNEDSADKASGTLSHTLGTYLRLFRGCSAWEALGYETFEAFCVQHLGISERHALRLIFFASIATKEQAALGLRKCVAGFALARALDADGIGALLPSGPGWQEPGEWAARLGEPVAFAASSATRVERLVVAAARPALPEGPPSRKVAAEVKVRRGIITRVAARRPALEALGVTCFARGGKAKVAHRDASTREEFAALRALYDALEKA